MPLLSTCNKQAFLSAMYLPWMLLVILRGNCRFLSPHIKKIKLVCFGYLVSIEACKIVSYETLVLIWLTATDQVYLILYVLSLASC